jgi:hypothetical protein
VIAVGTTTKGATVPAGETDWYRFTAIAGTQYHVQAQLGTLTSATIKLLGTNGVTQLATATGASPSFDSPTLGSAVYFITVTSATSGTYNLSLSALPGPSAGLSNSQASSSMLMSSSTFAAAVSEPTSGPVLWAPSTPTSSTASKIQSGSSAASQVNDEALLTLLNLGGNSGSASGLSDSTVAISSDKTDVDSEDESLDGIDAMFELIGGTARV